MITGSILDIEDKVVLTKIANTLSVFIEQREPEIVNINANIYNLTLPPSGTLPPPSGSGVGIKTPVFLDGFNINIDNLPGTGSLIEKSITYVCDTWNLTLK